MATQLRRTLLGVTALLLLAGGAGWAQEKPQVKLSVASEPADASVFVRYAGQAQGGQERFLGRTPKNGQPLQTELAAGPAEVVVAKDGFIFKVQDLELRSGGAARLEVRLTRDIEIPRKLTLKGSADLVPGAREGLDDLYVAVLSHVNHFFVEEQDPFALVERSTRTMIDILNAVREREMLLQRELSPDARRRYYGDELDLRAYPKLVFERRRLEEGQAYTLGAGPIAIEGKTDRADIESYLTMLQRCVAFLKHKWDTRKLLSDSMLTRCAIEGLLGGLDDDHTHFMTPADVEELAFESTGAFGGIGIVVSLKEGHLTVIAPMEGSPGHRAGILPGDVISAIDGKVTLRLTMKQAVDLMRGEVDSPVELTIRRGDREPFPLRVVRAKIQIRHTAHHFLGQKVGYLRISSFMHDHLDEEVMAAIESLRAQGAKGLIIDVRNNPGGLLTQAHKIADLFVRKGVIVSTQTRIAGESRSLTATEKGTRYGDMPLVVLQNRGSASASEILAGTLKEHGIATLVGELSFGKGSVQRILPLEPFQCALALTVATYHLPSGATPHKKGVAPDVEIKLNEEQALSLAGRTNYTWDEEDASDAQLVEAVKQLKAKLAKRK